MNMLTLSPIPKTARINGDIWIFPDVLIRGNVVIHGDCINVLSDTILEGVVP